MSVLTDTFTSIANAIRTVMGGSSTYKPSDMPTAISSFKYLPTTTTATASDLLSGKTAYNSSGTLLTGNVVKYIKGFWSRGSFGATGWTPMASANDRTLVALRGEDNSTVAYAYDENYTQQTNVPNASCSGNMNKSHGSIGKYAVFGGGRNGGSSGTHYSNVDAYDDSLTKTAASSLPYTGCWGSSIKLSNYLFMAGWRSGYSSRNMAVVYDHLLTRTNLTNLTTSRNQCWGGKVGKYFILAGGGPGSGILSNPVLEIYDSSLTKIASSTTLSQNKCFGDGLSGGMTGYPNGDIMIITGGYTSNTVSTDRIETINTNLTVSTSASTLSQTKISGCTLPNFYGKTIILGGKLSQSDTTIRSNIDLIDVDCTRITSSYTINTQFDWTSNIGTEFCGSGIVTSWGTSYIIAPNFQDIKVTN